MSRRKYNISETVDVVTPESSERGDFDDSYIEKIHRFSTPKEAAAFLCKQGARNWLDDNGDSFYEPEFHVVNYETGQEERRAFHIRGMDVKPVLKALAKVCPIKELA